MEKVNLAEKFALFTDHWHPRIVGELNGQQVKLVKFRGDFLWHRHEGEDEMFLVVKGRFRLDRRDGSDWVEEGEFIIVPSGVEHRSFSDHEVQALVFEPAGTLNTGDAASDRTVREPERI